MIKIDPRKNFERVKWKNGNLCLNRNIISYRDLSYILVSFNFCFFFLFV